ncbi:hypothetical protein [Thalassospira povalilytica]|uniref:hypothetical protein n=1 Tax=Thalassospira povalilytica TaxID=732237 RepID=UPI003AA864C1
MKIDDGELLNREFWTQDPESLGGLIDHLPNSTEVPIIEFQYDLTRSPPEESIKVKCVHCKVSQPNHSKGFVLKLPNSGERFLIGHVCGKLHYSAKFEQVRREFKDQRKRSLQLQRLGRIQVAFPKFIESLDIICQHPTFATYDELNITLIDKFSDLQHALASSSGELKIPVEVRDHARELNGTNNYEAEKEEWDNLTVTAKKNLRAEGIKPPEPPKYYKTQFKVVGRFNGLDFTRRQSQTVDELTRISNLLKASYKELSTIQTNTLRTSELGARLKVVSKLANEIQRLARRTNAMTAFFQPENLAAIASWANQHTDFHEHYSASGYNLMATDSRYGGKKYVVGLPSPTPSLPDLNELLEFIDQADLATH